MTLDYRQLKLEHKQQIIAAFNSGMECRGIPNYLDVSERAVARVLKEAGVNTKWRNRYTLNESYFDVIDSQAKAYLLGPYPRLGLQRKKTKIEQILRSYKYG
jgi:hypothetical protein